MAITRLFIKILPKQKRNLKNTEMEIARIS